jgi:hypothetical protein
MNPAKAPWYFLGLQEMLVYFDPWIAGVVMPTLIIIGLMVIPYIDTNPLGAGYYTWKQRKFAIGIFLFGFIVLWVSMITIGTFIRGPGWQWFWPGQTWDHNRLIYEVNRDLPDIFGITSNWGKGIFGAAALVLPAPRSEKLPAKKLAAVLHHDGLPAHHGRIAHQDALAAPIPH